MPYYCSSDYGENLRCFGSLFIIKIDNYELLMNDGRWSMYDTVLITFCFFLPREKINGILYFSTVKYRFNGI